MVVSLGAYLCVTVGAPDCHVFLSSSDQDVYALDSPSLSACLVLSRRARSLL